MSPTLADQYQNLVSNFEAVRDKASMGGRSEDHEDLRSSVRSLFRFERQYEILTLRAVSASFASASARLEKAQSDLRRYASRRAGMEARVLNNLGEGGDPL